MEDYDYINPSHYKSFSKETIDMMIDIYGKEKVATYCEINAFKYKIRIGEKPDQPIERDLDKARWYLNKASELRMYSGQDNNKTQEEIYLDEKSRKEELNFSYDYGDFNIGDLVKIKSITNNGHGFRVDDTVSLLAKHHGEWRALRSDGVKWWVNPCDIEKV